jgi:protein SHQ1
VNPYYLRLNFPHNLLEDDASSAQYDGSSGYLTVTLTKEVKGLEFEDLDLLAKLLAPRQTKNQTTPSIEVLASTTAEGDADEADDLSEQLDGMKLADGDKGVLEAGMHFIRLLL